MMTHYILFLFLVSSVFARVQEVDQKNAGPISPESLRDKKCMLCIIELREYMRHYNLLFIWIALDHKPWIL